MKKLLSLFAASVLSVTVLSGCDGSNGKVSITFLSSELISLIENCGLMGIPIPKPIINAISVLTNKLNEDDKEDEKE